VDPRASATEPANDFSISASPSTVSVDRPPSGGAKLATPTVSTTVTKGTAVPLRMQVSGLPAGMSWSLKPTPAGSQMTSASTAALWLITNDSTPCGSYPLTITATDGFSGSGATHSTQLQLSVVNCPDFSISANPSALSVRFGQTASATISTAVTNPPAQPLAMSVSGVKKDATASFDPSTVSAGGTSTLSVTAAPTTPCTRSPTNVTITATGPGATHTITLPVQLTQDCLFNGDFEDHTRANAVTKPTGWDTDTSGNVDVADLQNSSVNSVTGLNRGGFAAFLGGLVPGTGSASIEQTFVAPPRSSPDSHYQWLMYWFDVNGCTGENLGSAAVSVHTTLTDVTTGVNLPLVTVPQMSWCPDDAGDTQWRVPGFNPIPVGYVAIRTTPGHLYKLLIRKDGDGRGRMIVDDVHFEEN